ncbi:hypothetical protein DWW52_04815 [Odoribacter sp. AF15-53]|nr:hypothetical protein DWW52_04815 [Odoribacter sp. AF15-53]
MGVGGKSPPVHKVELPAPKVHKVYKVTGVLQTVSNGSTSCREQSAPQGSTNLINFINFINLTNFIN